MNKYRAKPTRGFPSKLEAAVYDMLVLREKAGELKNIKRQVPTPLLREKTTGKVVISWKCDFTFDRVSDSKTVYCEAKGKYTQSFVIKLRLFKTFKIGELEIWGGSYLRPKLLENFIP